MSVREKFGNFMGSTNIYNRIIIMEAVCLEIYYFVPWAVEV